MTGGRTTPWCVVRLFRPASRPGGSCCRGGSRFGRDTWPMERPSVTVRVLGAVEMVDASGEVRDVPGRRLQTLLARLVAQPGQIVSVDALVDAVWPDGLPDAPDAALQTQVFRLRKRLRLSRCSDGATRAPGYALELGAATVDAIEFERGVRAAIGAEPSVARARLTRRAVAVARHTVRGLRGCRAVAGGAGPVGGDPSPSDRGARRSAAGVR